MNQYRQGLQGLATAIAAGLPGDKAYALYQDLEYQRQQRLATQRSAMTSLMDMAVGLSQQGYSPEDISSIVSNYAANIPGLGPKQERRVTDFSSAIPAAPVSPTDAAAAGGADLMPDGSLAFGAEQEANLERLVTMYRSGGQYTLHEARMEIMDMIRAEEVNGAKYSPMTLAYIFAKIGEFWGDPSDPVAGLKYGDWKKNDNPDENGNDNNNTGSINYGGYGAGYTPLPVGYGGLQPGVKPTTWGIR